MKSFIHAPHQLILLLLSVLVGMLYPLQAMTVWRGYIWIIIVDWMFKQESMNKFFIKWLLIAVYAPRT